MAFVRLYLDRHDSVLAFKQEGDLKSRVIVGVVTDIAVCHGIQLLKYKGLRKGAVQCMKYGIAVSYHPRAHAVHCGEEPDVSGIELECAWLRV